MHKKIKKETSAVTGYYGVLRTGGVISGRDRIGTSPYDVLWWTAAEPQQSPCAEPGQSPNYSLYRLNRIRSTHVYTVSGKGRPPSFFCHNFTKY